MTVVADASPLIALAQVKQLPLLERLFGEILVPPAVVCEVGLSLPAFIRERRLSRPIPAAVLYASGSSARRERVRRRSSIACLSLAKTRQKASPGPPRSGPALFEEGFSAGLRRAYQDGEAACRRIEVVDPKRSLVRFSGPSARRLDRGEMSGFRAEEGLGRGRAQEALVRTEAEVEERRLLDTPLEIITVEGQPE